jgi:hypothetical protein
VIARRSLFPFNLKTAMPIENSEPDANMEFAHSPSNLPSGAKAASSLGGRHGGDLQISNCPELENLALRHQLGVLQRSVKRPKLTDADRFVWARLSQCPC